MSNEETKIEEINSPESDKNTNTETKKLNKKPMKKGVFVGINVGVGVLSLVIGGLAGYFIYGALKPEQVYTTDSSDVLAIKERGDASENLIETFREDPYNLVNYSFIKFASQPYSLSLSAGLVHNFSGDQNVRAATYNLNGTSFNQNISSTTEGAIVKVNTAFRFYDDLNGSIVAYENKLESEWVSGLAPTKTYTYNDYIDSFGKLTQGMYCVDAEGKFVASSFESGQTNIIGSTIYQITKNSVNDCKVVENSDSYTIRLELNPSYACYYYARQVKYNGTLDKNPTFTSPISMIVNTDKNFNLINTSVSENYEVTKVSVGVSCSASMVTNYYYGDNELVVNGWTVKVPSIEESFPLSINMEGDFE